MWTAGELAIKGLTPMLMPVTVMHDPRTAVGAIADLALRTPEKRQGPALEDRNRAGAVEAPLPRRG
jgi:hypothetical protein